jgi:hypothetical protein
MREKSSPIFRKNRIRVKQLNTADQMPAERPIAGIARRWPAAA